MKSKSQINSLALPGDLFILESRFMLLVEKLGNTWIVYESHGSEKPFLHEESDYYISYINLINMGDLGDLIFWRKM